MQARRVGHAIPETWLGNRDADEEEVRDGGASPFNR